MKHASEPPDAARDLQARLSRIEALLDKAPAQSLALAQELLAETPDEPMASLFQGIAHRLMGRPEAAIAVLEPLARRRPDAPMPALQLGLALRETGNDDAALQAMRRAVAIREDFSDAWLALAELLTAMGNSEEADRAFLAYIERSASNPRLAVPAAMLRENRRVEAETFVRKHLQRHPNDVVALGMLADLAAQHGHLVDAEALLQDCLRLAPSYGAARHNHAVVLMRLNRASDALGEADRLLAQAPASVAGRTLKAAVLVQLLEYDQAIEVYEGLLAEQPNLPEVWASLGHALRTVGQRERSIEAYRTAIARAPDFGEAYWNLANLKTFQITDGELADMQSRLDNRQLGVDDRTHFHFAIGKALEDRRRFEESFRHYARGNDLRRQTLSYDPEHLSRLVSRSKRALTREFFAQRDGYGASSTAPIFIVGLPRSGSTLVEQILASHPAVEGTMELPHVMDIAKSLVQRAGGDETAYPELLANLSASELRAAGEDYLERSRPQRKRGAPRFIDKMPNNFMHLGLIQLMLPNARIVDVRRHPLACGLSLFKQVFAQGQPFSYGLTDIGRYYRDYVELMAHFDTALPGHVHRVAYESLVGQTQSEVHRLLDYCGLPFEKACLRFHENTRPVSTPSSEQVRIPVFADAVDHWRHYEPWLAALKAELGPLAETYPQVFQG